MSQAFAASQPSNFPPPYTLVLANLTPGCSEAVPRDRRVASLIIPFAIRAAGCGLQCTARPMAASRSGHKNPTNIQVSAACSVRKFKPIIMGPVASGCRRRQGLRPDHRPPRAAKTVICAMDADVFFFFFFFQQKRRYIPSCKGEFMSRSADTTGPQNADPGRGYVLRHGLPARLRKLSARHGQAAPASQRSRNCAGRRDLRSYREQEVCDWALLQRQQLLRYAFFLLLSPRAPHSISC